MAHASCRGANGAAQGLLGWLIKQSTSSDSSSGQQLSDVHPSTSSNSESKKRSHDAQISVAKKKKDSWIRQYLEDYIQFGFIESRDNKPLCVICNTELANESMKPSKLMRHLELKHPEYKEKPKEFFVNKKRLLNSRKKNMESIFSQSKQTPNVVLASYEISQLITQSGYPHQVDESTDISDYANMIYFVRYDFEGTTHEEFLFCKLLPSRTTAEEIFKLINDYMNKNDIEWNKCVGLSSDGGRAMSGIRTGLYTRVKAVAPEYVWTPCSIHREALAAKKMPLPLTETLQECVKFINYIKSRPLNSRIFSTLCQEMESDHEHLLYTVRCDGYQEGMF
ncbi:SCAN domain-containing protein 3 [Eumeta japonica]|uniref:SCAN domain-containing protein 3 n=1 Tax=Eumeta variegata TaxID=151549 RepID=A0A4C1UCD1_EUMVA|nr:SCAN domain-containing protein 3 [Eumeta japonica]